LQGAQTQRELLTEMALYQWTQSGEMVRPAVKRFNSDQVDPLQDMTDQEYLLCW
jgi:hypothetical protein